MKLITIKYKCGTTFSQQLDELYDGPWEYRDLDEKIFYKDFVYEGYGK